MKSKNYREKYKEYYNINFDNQYVIHHIDFNRKNNKINNLLLLPKTLHEKYHACLMRLDARYNNNKILLDPMLEIDKCMQNSNLYDFLNIYKECEKWIVYKQRLDIERLEKM